MQKEDSRIGKRDVSTIPCAKATDNFPRVSASANVQPSDPKPPTAEIPLIMSTKLSLPSASPSRWRAALSSQLAGPTNARTHSSSFFHSRRHSRNNTNIWSQTHRWRSLINRQFPLCWTWHTLSEKGNHSTLRTSHSDLVQDVAKELFYGGNIFFIHKNPNYFIKVWLLCLPAMTSECIFKDTLRNDTQVFQKFRDSILEICLNLNNSNSTSYFRHSSMQSRGAGTSKKILRQGVVYHYPQYWSYFHFHFFNELLGHKKLAFENLQPSKMASNLSLKPIDSDVFYVEQPSNDQCIPRPKTPLLFNSTEISGNDTREMISISSIASPEPQVVTIDSDSNEPTMPYGFGRQLPIVPPSLNDLNLPPNPFSILATIAVVNQTEEDNNNEYSLQSQGPSDPSPSQHHPWLSVHITVGKTSNTTTDDDTFYSSDEPRRVYWSSSLDETFHAEGKPRWIYLFSSPSPPSPPRKMKRKL